MRVRALLLTGSDGAHVEARTERRIGARQDDRFHHWIIVGRAYARWKLFGEIGRDRVSCLGTIQGDDGRA